MAIQQVVPPLYRYQMPPPGKSDQRRRIIFWAIRYSIIVVLVSIILMIPMLIFKHKLENVATPYLIASEQYQYFIYFLFSWLECTWLMGCLCDVIIMSFPYSFKKLVE